MVISDAYVKARAKSAGDMKRFAPTKLSFGCDGETGYGMSRGRQSVLVYPRLKPSEGDLAAIL